MSENPASTRALVRSRVEARIGETSDGRASLSAWPLQGMGRRMAEEIAVGDIQMCATECPLSLRSTPNGSGARSDAQLRAWLSTDPRGN